MSPALDITVSAMLLTITLPRFCLEAVWFVSETKVKRVERVIWAHPNASEPIWGDLGASEHFRTIQNKPQETPRGPKATQETPKGRPRSTQRHPKGAQRRPEGAQEAPKRRPGGPREPQGGKRLQGHSQGKPRRRLFAGRPERNPRFRGAPPAGGWFQCAEGG